MPSNEFQGMAPWAVFVAIILTAVLSWLAQAWLYRHKRHDAKIDAQVEAGDRLVIHRDELTFQLLQNARLEMASARIEVEDLRDEVRKLRSMENHFFYFQQSLDHLEALLFADTVEARAGAERNARAFLTRMRRLNEAKGTLTNEAQRAASEISLLDRKQKLGGEDK
jgi:hypothetical protein